MENLIFITIILGLLLGTAMLGAVILMFIQHREFALGGTVLTLFGVLLLGLSIWRSVELSVDPQGGVTAKFEQEQVLGAVKADSNSKIAQLELQLNDLNADIARLKERFPEVKPSQVEEAQIIAREMAFKKNSEYTILIFYRSNSEQKAKDIEEALLSAGYRSSSTTTDLREAKRQFSSGKAWIIYTQRGREKLEDVEKILRSIGMGRSLEVEPDVVPLKRGDIQVLIF